ncbi:hypothetical protein SAM23877_6085 [Streptomyces ambofaciens ATCC 23877]|uniref:Uncharacterized protein n=1 Tax=Streptomyces ambofaciens (strain ATCC 23877 / 3486 / DSM 40053 / JCM 4204 / NBRC 12836 / NRRL B-2516) TaxID=278992 RepID=A0A0K2B186_STRA7|nr:hypothetical protein SAM23877_6085 [Streptomyces ambofaciens ATCC 23877]
MPKTLGIAGKSAPKHPRPARIPAF